MADEDEIYENPYQSDDSGYTQWKSPDLKWRMQDVYVPAPFSLTPPTYEPSSCRDSLSASKYLPIALSFLKSTQFNDPSDAHTDLYSISTHSTAFDYASVMIYDGN